MKRLLAACAAALLLVACGSQDNTEPPAPLVKFTPKVQVQEVWSADVGAGAGDILLGLVPAVDGGHVYAAGRDGDVSAYDAATGKRIWRTDTKMKLGGGPGVGAKLVAVGSTSGYVQALAADDGRSLWKHFVNGAVIAAPAVSDTVVVVHTGDGHLIGLSAADGHQLWIVSRDVPRLTLRGNGSPVIRGSTVYAGFDDGNLMALKLADGQVQWETPVAVPTGQDELQQMVDLDGEPLISFGIIYAATYQGKLAALTADAGQPLWTAAMSSYNGTSIADGRLFVSDEHGIVHAYNAASGEEEWKQPAMRARTLTRPTPFHGTIAVGDYDGYVHFLSQKTGELVARVRADSERISAAPVVAGDELIVLSDGGELVAYKFPGSLSP